MPTNHKLYVYTYPSAEAIGVYKIGDSSKQTNDNRIAQQDTTGSWEKQKIIYKDIDLDRFTDKDVHKQLEKMGYYKYREDKDREWFLLGKDNYGVVLEAVNALKYGISRRDNFKPRESQQRAIDKMVSSFKNGDDKFLLGAVMRFGKVFTTLKVANQLGWKRILILSAKPDVANGWEDLVENHIDFVNWNWNDTKNSSKNDPLIIDENSNKVEVCFISLQDAKGRDIAINGIKTKLQQPLSLEWDCLIIDETHFGVDTEKSNILLERVTYKKKIEVSGTPFKKLQSGEYNGDNVFIYTILDEVRDIEAGLFTYYDLPKLNTVAIDLEKSLVEELEASFEEDEGFRFATLFAVEDGKFKNEALVKTFLEILKPLNNPKFGGGISPWYSNEICNHLDHLIWFLPPRIDFAKALKSLLKLMPAYSDYKIFVAAGDNDGISNEKVLKGVERCAVKNEKSIVLSCGKFDTGVTMKMWHTVFMMNDTESPEKYFQSSYRVKSPDKEGGKDKCFVIDLNPNRALTMVYKYSEVIAQNEDKSTETVAREYMDVIPVLHLSGNKISKFDYNDTIKALYETRDFTRSWSDGNLVEVSNIDEELHQKLQNVEKGLLASKKTVKESRNQVRSGKTYKNLKKSGKSDKEIDNQFSLDREKIQSIMQRIPTYLFLNENLVNIVGLDSFEQYLDNELFEKVVGTSYDVFKLIIEEEVISKSTITKLIEKFNLVIRNHGNKLIEMADELYFTNTQTKTPRKLVKEMLDKLPQEIWSDKTKRWLDPCCGRGVFLYEIVECLVKGLEEEIPDYEARLNHILTNQIYGVDIDPVMCLVTEKLLRSFSDTYQGNLNVYNTNSLEKDWDDMKFDVVVGNPPYNGEKRGSGKAGGGNAIWQKFVESAYSSLIENGRLLLIHPSTWREGYRKKLAKAQKILFNNQIDYLKLGFKWPGDAVVFVDYYLLTKTAATKKTKIKSYDYEGELQIYGEIRNILNGQNPIINDIFKKLFTIEDNGIFTRKSFGGLTKLNQSCEKGNYAFVNGAKLAKRQWTYKDYPHVHQFDLKVIMVDNHDFRPYIDNGELGIGDHVHYILLNNIKECEFFVSIVNSKICKWLQSITLQNWNHDKNTWQSWNNAEILRKIEVLSLGYKTDQELYQHFNLSAEEIDYIEESLK